MADQFGISQLDHVLEGVLETYSEWKKEYSKRPELASGTRRATDEELLALVSAKIKEYPPQPMITPGGMQVTISPWIAALHLPTMEGTKEDLDRLRKLAMQNGGQ